MRKNYFGTDGIRGRVGEHPVTPAFFLQLGLAAGTVFANRGSNRVIIGKDTRISGYMFESSLEAGFSAAGMDVFLLGPMPTPAIAYLTRTFNASMGIVISASHNPYYDNGIKFFSGQGLKLPDETELQIEALLDKKIPVVDSANLGKAHRIEDAAGRYIEYCKATLQSGSNLSGMHLVIDTAHGATYHVAPGVFRELGAKITVIGNQPDGLNINKGCGSTHMQTLQKAVLQHKADLGISFDGDGDRMLMVDAQGNIVDGDELLFIIAMYLAEKKQLQGGVVGTVMSNLGMEHGLAQHNIPFVRAQVGDRYVNDILLQKSWWLGGEPSGHIICRHVSTTGDGIVAALKILSIIVEKQTPLHELKQEMQKYPQLMINVPVHSKQDIFKNRAVNSAIALAEKEMGTHGRILLRPSGTEPVIRVMVEGESAEEVNKQVKRLAGVVADEVG
ncbi:MAG: phosphoglucosamine mutase [Endozoicomonadaceae bacterium]|nr:phosphoglucosamine mutase [Endozoicomonadaceae bacterium]MCY4330501.1 phosphoglucosamine mutase [Endozoicomonadaceae bacterium]